MKVVGPATNQSGMGGKTTASPTYSNSKTLSGYPAVAVAGTPADSATVAFDKLGLSMLDKVGADRVMWAHDYPHGESALGYSWSAMRQVVEATTPDNARKILGSFRLRRDP